MPQNIMERSGLDDVTQKPVESLHERESETRSVVSDSLRPHGLYSPWNFQARILEWVAFPFSRESSQPRSPALQADSLPTELQVVTCIFEDQLRKDKMTVHFFKNLMLYLKNNFIRKANICYYV